MSRVNEHSRRHGLQLLSVTDPVELDKAAELDKRLNLVEPLLERWSKVSKVSVGKRSELAMDDEITAWRHLSHTVTGAINLATDNLRAFRDLVRPRGTLVLPQVAHFAILRAALEGGSLALWLVGPEDPRERIQRLLRVAARELADEHALRGQIIGALANDAEKPISRAKVDEARKQRRASHKKHANHIAHIARTLSLRDPVSDPWKVGYAEIVREATALNLKGYYGETIWRIISGLTHPSQLRTVSHSNVEKLDESADGVFHAVVTTDLSLTRMAFEAAILNTRTAVEAFAGRKVRPGDRARYNL